MTLALVLTLAMALASAVAVPSPSVFVSGREGYACFRIPAIVRIPENGDLLAFAEGRRFSCADHGWNDIVMKRSADNGNTWSGLQVVYGESSAAANVTIGNPAPVFDTITGTLLLPCTRNNNQVLILNSTDSGRTWSPHPRDITASVKDPAWTWYATGPPAGLQLKGGRIIVPSDHTDAAGTFASHIMFSDDHGASWGRSESIAGGNECQAVVAQNGSLLLNMRTAAPQRQVAYSSDYGNTWSTPTPSVAETACEASTIALPDFPHGPLLVMSSAHASDRSHMTLHTSTNSGASWVASVLVYGGPAAYSALVELAMDAVGLLFEKDNYATIDFNHITLS